MYQLQQISEIDINRLLKMLIISLKTNQKTILLQVN